MSVRKYTLLLALTCYSVLAFGQKKYSPKQISKLKNEVAQLVEQNHKQTQVMIDKIFSFAELGFQEFESSRYLTGILKENGFEISRTIERTF